MRVMGWPSRRTKEKTGGKKAIYVDEKYKKLVEEWNKIPQSVIDTLLDSMQRRCQAVIDSRGFAIKY
uniref:Uncharacterized protein n=1 Tax=Caenorhabditis japonica TaxID=281687 RepID=A0A8R1IJ48_CAEJA